MNNLQKSKHYHDMIINRLELLGFTGEEIKAKLVEIDSTIYDTVLNEKINDLDEATYQEFKQLVESNASDEEIKKIVSFKDDELHEKVIKKLEEYLRQ